MPNSCKYVELDRRWDCGISENVVTGSPKYTVCERYPAFLCLGIVSISRETFCESAHTVRNYVAGR